MYKKIVTTRTPLRVSFLGGGTDIPIFYKKKNGIVISSSIDKFVYVTVKRHGPLFFKNYRLNYSRTENKNKLGDIENNIIRETLKLIKINKPIYISSISDVPAHTGLGSSSAFTVGLIKALYEFKNKKISNLEVAKLACKIEINKVKSPIGKQDQYATAIGGFNCIYFSKNSNVKVKKITKINIIKNIFNNSFFVWIGGLRKTNDILKDQNSRLRINLKNLTTLKNLTSYLYKQIKNDNFTITEFAELLNASWQIKKNLSKKINSNMITKIYNLAIKNGALGGKLLGAGAGGFLFLVVKKKESLKFYKKMCTNNKNLRIMRYKYYEKGTEVVMSL